MTDDNDAGPPPPPPQSSHFLPTESPIYSLYFQGSDSVPSNPSPSGLVHHPLPRGIRPNHGVPRPVPFVQFWINAPRDAVDVAARGKSRGDPLPLPPLPLCRPRKPRACTNGRIRPSAGCRNEHPHCSRLLLLLLCRCPRSCCRRPAIRVVIVRRRRRLRRRRNRIYERRLWISRSKAFSITPGGFHPERRCLVFIFVFVFVFVFVIIVNFVVGARVATIVVRGATDHEAPRGSSSFPRGCRRVGGGEGGATEGSSRRWRRASSSFPPVPRGGGKANAAFAQDLFKLKHNNVRRCDWEAV